MSPHRQTHPARTPARAGGRAGLRIAVISDFHVMGPQEKACAEASYHAIGADPHPVRRRWRSGLHRVRRRFWNAHPEWREAAFLKALEQVRDYKPDWVIANGDYGGDHGGVGVSDDATFESAAGVIQAIRRRFRSSCRFVFGDHDLGKYSTLLRGGGIRLRSLELGEERLGIPSFWHEVDEDVHLIGINSSLFTLDQFLPEALVHEIPEWEKRRDRHYAEVSEAFLHLPSRARVLLFCHDPSALHALAQLPAVRNRLGQIERTVIGHLHSPGLLKLARLLPRKPGAWKPRYPVARIIAHGLEGVQSWAQFKPVVCPSTFGTGHHIRGGLLFIEQNAAGHLVVRRRIVRRR
jgi:hypothetical protein